MTALNKQEYAAYPYRPDWVSKPKTFQQNKCAHAQYY